MAILHKRMRTFVAFMICLILVFCSFATEAFAYNSNYLSDTSWIDYPSAVTKSVAYDSEDGVRSCSISYLVDETNSSIYFQVLANNFGIKKNSDVKLYFDVSADGQNYSFFITKSGLQSNDDINKKFDSESNFSSSTSSDSGIYLAALDIKTKASVNKINLTLYIDDNKYELIDGIALNAVTTTKKPTTTKVKASSASKNTVSTTKRNTEAVTIIEKKEEKTTKKKSRSSKASATKFASSGKYISSGKTAEQTSKYAQTGTTAKSQGNTEPTKDLVHIFEKSKKAARIQDKIMLGSGITIGAIGLILIGYAIGKASDKINKKNQNKSDNKADNQDEEKIVDEDDFDF